MLEMIKEDDELERYLAPQTVKISSAEKDVDDLQSNEVFHFFDKEQPIYIKDNICTDSSVITATIFVSLLKDLCRRPLMGKMIGSEENLMGKAKGKIVFHKNIVKNTIKGRNDRLFCRYLRYSEDIIENQILKVALKKANRFLKSFFGNVNSVKDSYTEMIAYCNNALAHVSDVTITSKDISTLKLTGCYAYYKPVIGVAKMVLNEISIESNGNSKTTNYIIPYAICMNKLFEMYVRTYLKHVGVKTYSDPTPGIHIQKYDYKTKVLRDTGKSFANYINGPIKPDILLYDSVTDKKVVFDVKYKDISNKSGARDDRLQLLAYTLMYNCSNVGIFAPGDENIVVYEKNRIESCETRLKRYYHQVKMAVNSQWIGEFTNIDNTGKKSAIEYIEDLLV